MAENSLNHLAIIMDGNRRFSKRLMLKPQMGHEWGAKKVEELYEWCKEQHIKEVTLYTLSLENLKRRPKEELEFLFSLFRKEFTNIKEEKKFKDENVRIRFIGKRELMPKDIAGIMTEIEEKTKDNTGITVNFAIAYGGQAEIVDAIRKMMKDLAAHKIEEKDITVDSFKNYLYISSEPELIIRTGGERRTSNFLNYQAAYSEWYFTDKLWPEFDKKEFLTAIAEFSSRKRRFGK